MAETILDHPESNVSVQIAAVKCTLCGGPPQRCISFNRVARPLNLCTAACWVNFLQAVDRELHWVTDRQETAKVDSTERDLARIALALEEAAMYGFGNVPGEHLATVTLACGCTVPRRTHTCGLQSD